MVEDTITRVCVTCKRPKPLTDFWTTKKKGRIYHAHKCKRCIHERLFCNATRSRPTVYKATGVKACTDCKHMFPLSEFGWHPKGNRLAAYRCKPCQEAHKTRKRVYDLSYYQRRREIRRQQRQQNRLKHAAYNALQRAHRQRAPVIDDVDYAAIVIRDNSTCYLCHRQLLKSELSFDHVVPLSRGGNHAADNIKVCCEPCNLHKQTKLPEELTKSPMCS